MKTKPPKSSGSTKSMAKGVIDKTFAAMFPTLNKVFSLFEGEERGEQETHRTDSSDSNQTSKAAEQVFDNFETTNHLLSLSYNNITAQNKLLEQILEKQSLGKSNVPSLNPLDLISVGKKASVARGDVSAGQVATEGGLAYKAGRTLARGASSIARGAGSVMRSAAPYIAEGAESVAGAVGVGGAVGIGVVAGGLAASYGATKMVQGKMGQDIADEVRRETDASGFSMLGAMSPDLALGSLIMHPSSVTPEPTATNVQDPDEAAIEIKKQQLAAIGDKYSQASSANNTSMMNNLEAQSAQLSKDIITLESRIEAKKSPKPEDNSPLAKILYSDMDFQKLVFDAEKITIEANEYSYGGGAVSAGVMKTSAGGGSGGGGSGFSLASFNPGAGGGNDTSGGGGGSVGGGSGSGGGGDATQLSSSPASNATEGLNREVGKEEQGTAEQIISFFTSKGWTREQAAGFAANIQIESGFKTNATGDGGAAYGLAQWHPDRQANFAKWAHKDIRQSSLQEQLEFMQYELTQGDEKSSGTRIAQATSPTSAAKAIDDFYERSDKSAQRKRMELAEIYFKGGSASMVQQQNNSGVDLNSKSTADQAATTSPKNVNATIQAQAQNTYQRSAQQMPGNFDDPDIQTRLGNITKKVEA